MGRSSNRNGKALAEAKITATSILSKAQAEYIEPDEDPLTTAATLRSDYNGQAQDAILFNDTAAWADPILHFN